MFRQMVILFISIPYRIYMGLMLIYISWSYRFYGPGGYKSGLKGTVCECFIVMLTSTD